MSDSFDDVENVKQVADCSVNQPSVEYNESGDINSIPRGVADNMLPSSVNKALMVATGAAVLSVACAAVIAKSICSWLWSSGKGKATKSPKHTSPGSHQQAARSRSRASRSSAPVTASSDRPVRPSRLSPRGSAPSSPGPTSPATRAGPGTSSAGSHRVRPTRTRRPASASPTEPVTAAGDADATQRSATSPHAQRAVSATALDTPAPQPDQQRVGGSQEQPAATSGAAPAAPQSITDANMPAAVQEASAPAATAAANTATGTVATSTHVPVAGASTAAPGTPSAAAEAPLDATSTGAGRSSVSAPMPIDARAAAARDNESARPRSSRSVTLAPSVEAVEASRGLSRSSSRGSSRKLTVADVLREAIKEKKRNERLKQQLRAMEGGAAAASSTTGGPSSSTAGRTVPAQLPDKPTPNPGDVTGRDQVLPSPAGQLPVETDANTARRVSRDAADSQAADSPSKPAAGGASGRSDGVKAPAGSGLERGSSGQSLTKDLKPAKREAAAADGRGSRSVAEFAREVAALQEENKKLKQLLHSQARDSNAEVMASFYRRTGGSAGAAAVDERGLKTVPEESGPTGSSKTGSGAGRLTSGGHGVDGQGTPTNGSELGSFKDHLKLPLGSMPPGARSIGDSSVASSLRSGPGGRPSSLWSWVRGPGRRATTTVHDQSSIPDTLNTPRSSINPIQEEVLLDLLDSFHCR